MNSIVDLLHYLVWADNKISVLVGKLEPEELNKSFSITSGTIKQNVPIGLNEVVFNLINHSSYHRGQIVLFLRIMGYEVNISDYYWYKIEQLNLG